MGDVVALQPVLETLKFCDEGESHCDYILLKMFDTARKLAAVPQEIEVTNDKLKQLQSEYYEARQNAELVMAVCEAADDQRVMLWDRMPEGQCCLILARVSGNPNLLVMAAERRHATVRCSHFEIFPVREAA